MRVKKGRIGKLIVGTLCIIFLFGILGVNIGEAQNRPVIHIGYQPYGPYWVFHLAKEKGWWNKAGIDVTLTQFFSGSPQNYAMAKGDLDVCIMGDTPALIAAAQNIYDPVVIAIPVDVTPMYRIIAQPRYNSLKELKGKKIATMIGSLNEYWLTLVLKKLGWTSKDVKLIHMENPEMQAAMLANRIDAAVCNPSVAFVLYGKGLHLLTKKGFLSSPPGKIIKNKLYNIIVARREWVEKNPMLVLKFLAVMFGALDYWLNPLHTPEVNEWCRLKMNAAIGTELTPESFSFYWNSFSVQTLEPNVKIYMNPQHPSSIYQNWEEEAKFLVKAGRIPRVPDIKKILDNRFVVDLWEVKQALEKK
ncbi:NrtA/SsuA/CpmA family ABC transporter substrate-binding protein [Candidatus Aerophobetes bacterium]|nr:NrtA/SsuA/CpmA family ABC transporter substrate-binding protein [Candidatus Aerophobetes bacterium]